MFAFVFTIVFIKSAHAGFLSFFTDLFSSNKTETVYNSQNIPLLKAPQTPDPTSATGGAALNLSDGSALVPVVGPLGSVADADTYKLDQITTYTIRDGDTVSKIADMFGISANTIYWANNLKRGQILKVGDVLVILPISGIQYEVKKGDTIKSLAKKFKSDPAEIIAYNNLPADGGLTVGDTIIIPDAEAATPGISVPSSSKAPHTNNFRGGAGPDLGGYYMRPILAGHKSQGLHGYNGVDLADSCGTPIYAAADGVVLIARSEGWNGGYGRYVVIAHPNGTQTLYAHMSKVFVVSGQLLTQGTNIGLIGTTGNSTGCHVHFEVRGAINPF